MKLPSRRAPRRPAPPSERLHPPVEWTTPEALALPWWRRTLSLVDLGILVVVLGVLLTIAIGITLLLAFFLLDYLVG
jgi:hypothetical protein